MSLRIGELFHVVHVTESLPPVDAWYDEVLAPRRGIMDQGYLPHQMRDGSLLAIADAMIETMAPADRPGADAMPVGRFFARFGRHWHSLAWYTEDVGGIWDRLREQGIRVVGPGSPDERPETGDIYTHPKDTVTQLEFYQPDTADRRPSLAAAIPDPRFSDSWPAEWASSPNPLGIERMASMSVVTRDPDHARAVFADVLEGQVIHEAEQALTGTVSTFIALGPTVVEVAVPTGTDSIAGRDVAAFGEACHAVTFQVRDLDQTVAHLTAKHVGIAARSETTVICEPNDTFGAPFRFTVEAVPGDPRDVG